MKKSGFTLAETLMTMAIIGICATMLVNTVSNLKTDDLSNDIMAKKASTNFTNAVKQILVLDTQSGKMSDIGCTNAACLFNKIGKYIHVTKTLPCSEAGFASATVCGQLNDGVLFGVTYDSACSDTKTVNPLPNQTAEAEKVCGIIYYDVNGAKSPNQDNLDKFSIAVTKTGIKMRSATASGAS